MRSAAWYRAAVLWAGVAALVAASPAVAQAPPPGGEPADIAACLCLGRAVDTLNADMTAQQRAYAAARDELTRFDAQLQSARAGMDVNDPASVARFRELLEKRDAAFRRSTGLVIGDLNRAIARYNARVNDYNARCANRPRNPDLVAQVQATLRCPPPY
ncbi:MAG TPA: hypothetical protein VGS13_14180 [Stellaceae bacterium]|nr:hypothetical protein [Stellaceae bacterium]